MDVFLCVRNQWRIEMEGLWTIYAANLAILLGCMIGLWFPSLVLKNASIVDIFWGLGFVIVAWLTFYMADGYLGRKILICALVTVWGLRLAIHIGKRNRGKGEDRRYQAWRASYGPRFWWVSLFTVFGTQGILLWVISLVTQAGQISPEPGRWVWQDTLGLRVWAVGFFFEAVGDWQLARFKANPANKGKVMNRGLWATTRHPNYFGECLMWWGLFLITLANPANVWTIISPLTITILLLKVSGVTLLEKSIVETRPKYRDYMESTSAFIPWFPKRKQP
jgi:steroid 5-alpha reductase family enzyme